MPRPRMRLSFLIEIVAGLALGFGGIRYAHSDRGEMGALNLSYLGSGLGHYINPFVCTLSVCGLAAIVVERLAGKTPETFGLGRWTWALCGAFVLSFGLHTLKRLWVQDPNLAWAGVDEWLRDWITNGTKGAITSLIMALWAVYWIGRRPRVVPADGREWTGRIFGVLVVAWSMFLNVVQFLQHRGWLVS